MGKSTRAAEAAAVIYKQLGLKTRVVNADGGGTESAFSPLLAAGAAAIWHLDQWDEKSLFSHLDLATQGYWPLEPSVPNSPLVQGVKSWKPCPKCGGDSGAKPLTMLSSCATCGTKFPEGTILPVKRERVNGLEACGMVVFEGLTRFGEMLLERLKRVDPNGGNTVADEGFKISSPGQAHYLMAQSYLGQFVGNSRRLPVPLVFWTALEERGSDMGTPLYGPKGPGKALTTACIPWFTDVLHLDGYPRREKGVIVKDASGVEVLERKLFLAPHFPPDNPAFRFAAKTSAPHGGNMPLSIDPSMKIFFSELEKATSAAAEKLLS